MWHYCIRRLPFLHNAQWIKSTEAIVMLIALLCCSVFTGRCASPAPACEQCPLSHNTVSLLCVYTTPYVSTTFRSGRCNASQYTKAASTHPAFILNQRLRSSQDSRTSFVTCSCRMYSEMTSVAVVARELANGKDNTHNKWMTETIESWMEFVFFLFKYKKCTPFTKALKKCGVC